MEKKDCLSEEAIAAWADGRASAPERAVWEAHADSCVPCRERLSSVLGNEDIGALFDPGALEATVANSVRSQAAPRRHVLPGAWRQVAAASILAAAGWMLLRSGEAPARRFTLPEGRHVADTPQVLVAGPDRHELLTLPDGSRVRFAPGAEARLLSPDSGERVVIALAHGTLEVEAVKDHRAFRVVSEAGEVRVVGTSFTVKAFRIYRGRGGSGEGGEGPAVDPSPLTPDPVLSVLSVEVSEGIVEFEGAAGKIRVPAGKRGIVRPGRAPALQEIAAWDWKTAVARLGSAWERPGFSGTLEGMTLLAGTWEGNGDWRARAAAAAATDRERRIAVFLAGLLEDPGHE